MPDAERDAPCCAHPKCPGGSLCCCQAAGPERWPFGAESALRLIAATGNPNERKENRDAWAVTMPARPDVMAIEIARARERLEQAIAYVTSPAGGRA